MTAPELAAPAPPGRGVTHRGGRLDGEAAASPGTTARGQAAPFLTGFCEVGNHGRCLHVITHRRAAWTCTCGCHAGQQQVHEVAVYGRVIYGVPEVSTRDLVAHVRSGRGGATVADACRAARIVLDLGWRPTTGRPPPASRRR